VKLPLHNFGAMALGRVYDALSGFTFTDYVISHDLTIDLLLFMVISELPTTRQLTELHLLRKLPRSLPAGEMRRANLSALRSSAKRGSLICILQARCILASDSTRLCSPVAFRIAPTRKTV
jgi:hypothetical protein